MQRGDTLWDIADEQLGDPTRWTDIWDRNAGDDMGGGRTFDDPDLILPGWNLELGDEVPDPSAETPTVAPSEAPAPSSTQEVPDDVDAPHPTAPVVEATGPLPLVPEESTEPTPDTTATSGHDHDHHDHDRRADR